MLTGAVILMVVAVLAWCTRVFFYPEAQIRSTSGKLHLTRFVLLQTPWVRFYFQLIYGPKEDSLLYNQPWNIWNLVLYGGLIEKMEIKDFADESQRIQICYYRTWFKHWKYPRNAYHRVERVYHNKPALLFSVAWGKKTDCNTIPLKKEKYKP